MHIRFQSLFSQLIELKVISPPASLKTHLYLVVGLGLAQHEEVITTNSKVLHFYHKVQVTLGHIASRMHYKPRAECGKH